MINYRIVVMVTLLVVGSNEIPYPASFITLLEMSILSLNEATCMTTSVEVIITVNPAIVTSLDPIFTTGAVVCPLMMAMSRSSPITIFITFLMTQHIPEPNLRRRLE